MEYDLIRVYARSEQELTDFLNQTVGPKVWFKAKRVDVGGIPPAPYYGELPKFGDRNGIYRAVILKSEDDMTMVRLRCDGDQTGEPVIVRCYQKITVNPTIRRWVIGESGLPWEVDGLRLYLESLSEIEYRHLLSHSTPARKAKFLKLRHPTRGEAPPH
ncbi:hypothetical protein WEU32_02245 [Brevundimonas sp. BH3]|uniref:hypothetical protein n=1 Tax=Brevundimonas sp. BH3 TaxID=3133089 RepID=UPI003249833B